jgi:hypothetical protein
MDQIMISFLGNYIYSKTLTIKSEFNFLKPPLASPDNAIHFRNLLLRACSPVLDLQTFTNDKQEQFIVDFQNLILNNSASFLINTFLSLI